MNLCAVALVLLLDSSASIAEAEWRLQLEGTADALADPRVARIVERGPGLAVTAIAFDTGTATLLPWRRASDAAGLRAAAASLRDAERTLRGGTSLAAALDAAREALADAPCAAEMEVIDLSTDGEAPMGETESARDAAIAAGIRINAIGVAGHEQEDPAGWLRAHAVTPGGFAIAASWGSYAEAMVRKLVLEVASR
jgi:Ca-activated chloride channel homolog